MQSKQMFSFETEDICNFRKITTFQGFSMVGTLRLMVKEYNVKYAHLLPNKEKMEEKLK